MKCPVCVRRGLRSTVYPGGASTTCLGYSPGHFDEDGLWISTRDPNTTTTTFSCSNGHGFTVVSRDGELDRVVTTSAPEMETPGGGGAE